MQFSFHTYYAEIQFSPKLPSLKHKSLVSIKSHNLEENLVVAYYRGALSESRPLNSATEAREIYMSQILTWSLGEFWRVINPGPLPVVHVIFLWTTPT